MRLASRLSLGCVIGISITREWRQTGEVTADPIERILALRGYLDIVDSRQLNDGKRGDTCHAQSLHHIQNLISLTP